MFEAVDRRADAAIKMAKELGFKGEAGAAWIPFVVNRLDHAYHEQYFDK